MNMTAIAVATYLCGAFLSLALSRRPRACRAVSCLSAALASALIFFKSLFCLLGGESPGMVLAGSLPLLSFHFEYFPFSAFFALIVGGLGFVASLYALGYASEYDEKAGYLGFFYNLFLLAMSFVPLAANVFTFLFCWEGMTLASFFLVILEHEKPASRKAGYFYLVMSHAGTAFIFLLFFILARNAGSYEFAAFKTSVSGLDAGLKTLLFIFALIGFGTKAGIVPLHLWLPYAHPAAPGHVSALMSGVMIKTAVYGFIITVFQFLGGGFWWWGAAVLVVAAVSSVLGVLFALMEHDLKRLLAFHSVENIGIIFMGIGVSMSLSAFGRQPPAFLALCAGLFHVLNHAIFKGLLFMGAGSVIKSVHTRDMEEMGGLIKLMPVTAFCFLAGSIAISGLPPLNGFVSEWLTFQSLLSGFGISDVITRVICLMAASALALTGGLAAACFIKAFGITFLALPRSEAARSAREASMPEKTAMLALCLACAALGIFPGLALKIIGPAAKTLMSSSPVFSFGANGGALAGAFGGLLPLALLVLLSAGWFMSRLVSFLLGGRRKKRYAPVWGCGLTRINSRMEYTATGFSKPFRMLFGFIYRPVRETTQDCESSLYFPKSIHYSTRVTHVIKDKLYRPPLEYLLKASHVVRKIQAGSVNIYLGYISMTIAVLLIIFLMRFK